MSPNALSPPPIFFFFLQLARMHQGEFVAAVWVSFSSITQGYQLPPFCSLHGHHHIYSLRWSELALTAPLHPDEAAAYNFLPWLQVTPARLSELPSFDFFQLLSCFFVWFHDWVCHCGPNTSDSYPLGTTQEV